MSIYANSKCEKPDNFHLICFLSWYNQLPKPVVLGSMQTHISSLPVQSFFTYLQQLDNELIFQTKMPNICELNPVKCQDFDTFPRYIL